jgi:VWFA-related protein
MSQSNAFRRFERCQRFPYWPVLALLLLLLPGLVATGQTGSSGESTTEDAEETTAEGQATPGQGPESASDSPSQDGTAVLPPRFVQWLSEVDLLITSAERRLFESLRVDYQREAFIQEFWKVRDPFPETSRNELKERWPFRVAEAKSRFDRLGDHRSRIYMVHGRPNNVIRVRCTKKHSAAEIWIYRGTEMIDLSIVVVFYRQSVRTEMKLWDPSRGRFALDQVLSRSGSCVNGQQLVQVAGLISSNSEEYNRGLRRLLQKPRPRSQEWTHTFVAHSTDFPEGADPLQATLEFAFPGRNQHRTVVQGFLSVPLGQIAVGEFASYRSHDLLLTGEVIVDGHLFENFRYKFGFEEAEAPGTVPLSFQRFLRPGEYMVVVKLEDLNSNRVYREERSISVPHVDTKFEMPTFQDPRTEVLFAEATAAIEAGETSIRLVPPGGELHTGFIRIDTLVAGSDIDKVRFYLDEKLVLTKNRPPYNVELDLGSYPDLHTIRVEALDSVGQEVASDEVLINGGGYRFAVNLVEPFKGKRYGNSVRARAEVEVPQGRTLERLEFYMNEVLVATLYQEPYVQPIMLPAGESVAYVRAVAYLPDGNSTEDLVFINAPDYLEELDIQFVELYTTVLDTQGRPVEGISKEEFTVLEDGVKQQIARFERVEDLPIHVGILIDNSASMVGTLGEVRNAALSFFEQAITPRDRAAVITFNSFPHLAVELTNDRSALGSGLAGLVPEGQTALYDSVMFSLYYFTGIKGQRAILVLSDGKDEASRFNFDETLEYARRAGITIYSIGLRLNDQDARRKLTRLSNETGGRMFYIREIAELEAIYSQIQRELRSQYLIAYQSTNTSEEDAFRVVDLKIRRPRVEVKTLSGYYP